MKRRTFIVKAAYATACAPFASELLAAEVPRQPPGKAAYRLDPALAKDWLARWEKKILGAMDEGYCNHETGEEIGWLISPFLNGFYYGYRATGDPKWVEHLVQWAEAWRKRGVREPDGFIGWPKSGTGGVFSQELFTDSVLGEAMALRPLVLMADHILKTPALKAEFAPPAEAWLALANQTFEKWIARGCWREVKGGGLWVAPAFGLDQQTGQWTAGYARRQVDGFSHPANKQNEIARWLLAMAEVTNKPVYRESAEKWWRLMRSRMKLAGDGKYFVWNYWDPAGPWDFQPDGSPRHWVGVHPNGGYCAIDLVGIVAAFERGLVFTPEDLARLIATNRDFMWNQQMDKPHFRRIDGGSADHRWKDTPGVLWAALTPYDPKLRDIFLATHDPAGWGGLAATPWFLARAAGPE